MRSNKDVARGRQNLPCCPQRTDVCSPVPFWPFCSPTQHWNSWKNLNSWCKIQQRNVPYFFLPDSDFQSYDDYKLFFFFFQIKHWFIPGTKWLTMCFSVLATLHHFIFIYFIQGICLGLDLLFLWLLYSAASHVVSGSGPHIYTDTEYGYLSVSNETVSTAVHIHKGK